MNKIVHKAAQELGKVVQQHLSKTELNHDDIWIDLLKKLNEKWFEYNFLFRDYLLSESNEASFYLIDVLGRRLTLAYKQKEKPTKMHDLIVTYYRQAQKPLWHKSSIKRGFYQENIANDLFKPLAIILKTQREKLAKNYSSISQERHRQLGAYWFINGDTYIEVAEELSLFDVFDLIPPGGLNTETPPLIFISVIESLNERYGLLRSCGLPPSIWLTSPISNGNLKDLKKLRVQANLLIRTEGKNYAAYEKYFIKLQNEKSTPSKTQKFIGFVSFNEFCRSHVGQITLQIKMDSIDIDDSPDLEKELLNLPSLYPTDFNQVTAHVFRLMIQDELELDSQGKKGLYNYPSFLQLVKKNSAYANLSKSALIVTLQQQLALIFAKYIGEE